MDHHWDIDLLTVEQQYALQETGNMCLFINAATNPIIYGLVNPRYQVAFKNIFVSTRESTSRLVSNDTKTAEIESCVQHRG